MHFPHEALHRFPADRVTLVTKRLDELPRTPVRVLDVQGIDALHKALTPFQMSFVRWRRFVVAVRPIKPEKSALSADGQLIPFGDHSPALSGWMPQLGESSPEENRVPV